MRRPARRKPSSGYTKTAKTDSRIRSANRAIGVTLPNDDAREGSRGRASEGS